jgi:hypothetical protein
MATSLWPLSTAAWRRRVRGEVRDARSSFEQAVARRLLVSSSFSSELASLRAGSLPPEFGSLGLMGLSESVGTAGRSRSLRQVVPPLSVASSGGEGGAPHGSPVSAPQTPPPNTRLDREPGGGSADPSGGTSPPKEYDEKELAALVCRVLAAFTSLEVAVEQPSFSRWDKSIVTRALGLARFRSYVLPEGDLRSEGRAAIAELRQWRLPADVLCEDEGLAVAIKNGPDLEVRSALLSLLDERDYWSGYIDWYFDQQTVLAFVLLVIGA